MTWTCRASICVEKLAEVGLLMPLSEGDKNGALRVRLQEVRMAWQSLQALGFVEWQVWSLQSSGLSTSSAGIARWGFESQVGLYLGCIIGGSRQ